MNRRLLPVPLRYGMFHIILWWMGGRFAQSSLFLSCVVSDRCPQFRAKNVSRETFAIPIFCLFPMFSVFCALIGRYKIQLKCWFSAQPIGMRRFCFVILREGQRVPNPFCILPSRYIVGCDAASAFEARFFARMR